MTRAIVLLPILFSAVAGFAGDGLDARIENALGRAGTNATQLSRALAEVPPEQSEGMRFLVAWMPERDLQALSADFLLKNVRTAYRAWNEAPWKDRVSREMFLNDVLPYASINERRDDWREDFHRRFQPLVAGAKSPGEAAVQLNQRIFKQLDVRFSRERRKADQSPYETLETGTASCTGLSVLLVDACRAVGVPARLAGTPRWANKSGNHSWVEVWDGDWHFTGAAEPSGDQLNRGWFAGRARTAIADHPLHAIYATSFRDTGLVFPMVWDPHNRSVFAVNVTDRYLPVAEPAAEVAEPPAAAPAPAGFDVEASLHAVAQLERHLEQPRAGRPELAAQEFARVALTRKDAAAAKQALWADHVARIREERAGEMKARVITEGDKRMRFFYSVTGDKPENGRSLYISMHGGGGAPPQVNDRQWENQKRLYRVPEGVYVAPRAPTNAWNLWHQGHIDSMFDRLIDNLVVFENVDPNRVYILGYSAGGDGVYQLAPRMADRLAAASMMAGHPNNADPLGLRNLPFSIHCGAHDGAYNRNKVARSWGDRLAALRKEDPDGYEHWTKIYAGKGHWMDREDAAAIPWMAKYTRNPFPDRVVWKQSGRTHGRFYWLAVDEANRKAGAEVRAERDGQAFTVDPGEIGAVKLRLNDDLADLDREIVVTDRKVERYRGTVARRIDVLARTLAERGDPRAVFSAEIEVEFE